MMSEPIRPTRLVLLGAPGSGKGTQAERLAASLDVPAISTGDMLRQAVEQGSQVGKRVEEIINSGAFVDDETMAKVVRNRLEAPDASEGFLLDGYPRSLEQAETLAEILEQMDSSLDTVVSIVVPENELIRRALDRGREDDRDEVIRRRLDLYGEKTRPVSGYYEQLGLLIEVDGHQQIDAVTETILEALSVEAGQWC